MNTGGYDDYYEAGNAFDTMNVLTQDTELNGKNDNYIIFADRLLGSGGEAQVYFAERSSDKAQVLAKIYTNNSYNLKTDPIRDAMTKLLMDSEKPIPSSILPLIDIGRISTEFGAYYVDIIPYCEKGNLADKQFSYSEIREVIVPALISALEFLHNYRFVHRDIKPENIYLFNDSVVVGDFGTVVRVSNDSMMIKETITHRGTAGYTAPEVREGYAKTTSDCFSLGCTIATLYKGAHVYENLFNSGNAGSFYSEIKQKGMPLNCQRGEEDLQILVNALTICDENKRAGINDVRDWLNSADLFRRKWEGIIYEDKKEQQFDMLFKEKKYYSIKDLTDAFLEDWEAAKEFFYESNMFISYIKRHSLHGANEAEKILKNPPTSELEQDKCFAQFLHFFNRNDISSNVPPIYWRGYKFNSIYEIGALLDPTIQSFEPALNNGDEKKIVFDEKAFGDIADLLNSGFISWKMNTSGQYSQEEIDRISKIEADSKKHPKLATWILFAQLRGKKDVNVFKLLSEIFVGVDNLINVVLSEVVGLDSFIDILEYFEKSVLFDENSSEETTFAYDKDIVLLILMSVYPFICLGYENSLLTLSEWLSDNDTQDDIAKSNKTYLVLEEIAEDKQVLRTHFRDYGSYRLFYWLKQNIDLYTAVSPKGTEIINSIQSISIGNNMPISEQIRQFISLTEYFKDFSSNLQNDLASVMIGKYKKKTIIPKNSDGVISEKLYTPLAYIRQSGEIPDKSFIENPISNIADMISYNEKLIFNNNSNATEIAFCNLINEYLSKEFKNSNCVAFVTDIMTSAFGRKNTLGKNIAKGDFANHYLYRLCEEISSVFDKKRIEASELTEWRKLNDDIGKAKNKEYESFLSNSNRLNDLPFLNSTDYRPYWKIVTNETSNFDTNILYDRSGYNALQASVDYLDEKVKKRKIKDIKVSDFDNIVSKGERCRNEWNAFSAEFQKKLDELEPIVKKALELAGKNKSKFENQWNTYANCRSTLRPVDFDDFVKKWQSEAWQYAKRCKYCGGELNKITKKCKKCSMHN